MDTCPIDQTNERLRELSQLSRVPSSDTGAPSGQPGGTAALIEAARRETLSCPACKGKHFYRDGHASGLQRYRCRACGRTFNSLTGTPLARLRRKDKWLDYCETMLDPATTVRRAADRLGVHRNTTFRWRHRMLAWPKLARQTPLQGTVEAVDWHVPESHKGVREPETAARVPGAAHDQVCILLARDRDGRTHDAVTGNGPLTADQLTRHLAPALGAGARLATGAHPVFQRFAQAHGIACESVEERQSGQGRQQGRMQDAIGTCNVDAYRDRLRNWLQHFRGVATRYLDNYCGWWRGIDTQRIHSAEAFLRAAVGLFRK